MKFFSKHSKGFTLIEMVVASAIVVSVTVALLAAVAQNVVFTERADMVYTSSLLAQGRIDALRKFTFQALYDDPTIGNETDIRIDDEGTIDQEGEYTRTTLVEQHVSENPYLLRVKVAVDRIEEEKKSGHPVIMETLFADTEV